MNKNKLPRASIAMLGLVLFIGCEADRTRPPGVNLLPGEVHPLARERHLNETEILANAAALPAAPIGGQGWEPMFDGQSLTGWRVTQFHGGGQIECSHGLIIL